jgi:hypothetical protein
MKRLLLTLVLLWPVSAVAATDNEGWLWVVGIAALVIALVIALYLLKYLFIGGIFLFAWACESGFLGAAAYVACWIFLLPFMAVICIIIGALQSWGGE